MFENITAYIDKFFTLPQQVAILVITLSTMSLTQMLKGIYFGFHTVKKKEKRKAIIKLMALTLGICGGLIGYLTVVPIQPIWFWIFSGALSGGASMALYWLFIKIILPKLKSKTGVNTDG